MPYRQDETNQDRRYLRNALRHSVMDKLKGLNPDFLNAVARLAEAANTEDDYLRSVIDAEVLPKVERCELLLANRDVDILRASPGARETPAAASLWAT